jgi:hypothetical protein
MHRRMAVLGLSLLSLAAPACGADETPVEAGSSSTSPASTTAPDSTVPDSTVPDPATTARPTVPRPSVPPAPDTTATPIPEPDPGPARTVPLGQAFTIAVGESVGIAGEGLVVTYSQFVSDNRCPVGVQCITAGNGVIVVGVAKGGASPAGLTLNTTEGPGSAGYLGYTVTLVQLSRSGPSPAASLRVN